MNKVHYVILGLAIIVIAFTWSSYNGLVRKDEAVKTQWSQVENVYQRRFDLIPNVVATVKGAAKQDLDVFKEIADARTHYAGAQTVDQRSQAAGQIESSLARLLVIVENYPTLKSQESFQALIVELEGTENRVAVERGRFNETVLAYNVEVRKFPTNIIAGVFNFNVHELFQASSQAKDAPKVNF